MKQIRSSCVERVMLGIMAASVMLGAVGCAPGFDESLTYDFWIRGGAVVDGTGVEPYDADVLILADSIAYVGRIDVERLNVVTTIDATGKIVTPGFIDAHSHGDPLKEGFDNFVSQGVTTVVLGQDGRTPGFSSRNKPTLEEWRRAIVSPDADDSLITLARWMRAVEERGAMTNIAVLVGHGSLRYMAGVDNNPDLTEDQQVVMNEILQAGLDAGAFGLSSGLEYVPGRYAPKKEVLSLARVVGENDGVIMSHLRSEDGAIMEGGDEEAVLMQDALEEVIEQGEFVRVHVAHIKIVHARSADEGDAVLNRLRQARDEGVQITADVYPYLAGMSDFYFLYPIWARDRQAFEDAARNDREWLIRDTFDRVTWRGGPDKALVVSGDYAGSNLADIARAQGKPFADVIVDWGYGGPTTAHFTQNAAVQDVFITAPEVVIGTDGSPSMRHPRSFGTFPKIIQKYVVEDESVSLELAVRKMSGLTAEIVGLSDRGTLEIGKMADILVFDPANIQAKATWTEPSQRAVGFDYVLVNGSIAVISDVVSKDEFGRMLRKTR